MTLKLKTLGFASLVAALVLILGAGASLEASALDVVQPSNIYDHETVQIAVQENLQYGIGVSPGKLRDVKLVPGQRYEGSYKIYNEGQNDIAVVIGISPFSYSADYENVNLMTSSSYNQIQDWIEIDEGPIPLGSGEMKTVNFVINVPAETRGGGQYFAFINRIQPGSEPDEQGGMIGGVKQIGLTVGTSIEGEDLDVCGKIVAQDIAFWQANAPLVTSVTVENCGNVDFAAYGRIKVENALLGGGLIYETPDDKVVDIRVFPNGESNIRSKEINWDDAPLFGIFNVTQEVSIGDKTETIVKTVLILPAWIVVAAITIFAMIIAAIIVEKSVRKKRYKARARAQSSTKPPQTHSQKQ